MKKRGSSLFLALALCLTLLPAAAFANGESETSAPHTHYLCGNGETCSHVGGHNETDKITFTTAITQTANGNVYVGDGTQDLSYQCVLSEGTYYLATDLVLEGPPTLKEVGCIYIDSDVTLCLNGHTITIIDDRDAFDIRRSAEGNPPTLTLTDCQGSGKITHGASNEIKYLGNGVSLHQSCNFIMYGGSITDNTTVWNGGVYVEGSGKFYMHGGTISGNSAVDGGGVYANGNFTVSGAVQITGNKQGTSASNVYLRGNKTITIGTNHLSSNASIGVTTQNLPANEGIAIATGANLNDKQYFRSDTDENYLFYVTSGGTICMTDANAHGHPICGESCSHNGSSHTSQIWQPIGSAEELTAIQNSGGYFYLTDDVTLSSDWTPPSDMFLCLNGHTITGTAGKSTIAVGRGVSFTLTDCRESGKITHENSDAVGCGVSAVGSFIMYGGSITGNSAARSGGGRVRVRHHDRQRQRADHRQRQRRLERQ